MDTTWKDSKHSTDSPQHAHVSYLEPRPPSRARPSDTSLLRRLRRTSMLASIRSLSSYVYPSFYTVSHLLVASRGRSPALVLHVVRHGNNSQHAQQSLGVLPARSGTENGFSLGPNPAALRRSRRGLLSLIGLPPRCGGRSADLLAAQANCWIGTSTAVILGSTRRCMMSVRVHEAGTDVGTTYLASKPKVRRPSRPLTQKEFVLANSM
jgi:hypothetical protein